MVLCKRRAPVATEKSDSPPPHTHIRLHWTALRSPWNAMYPPQSHYSRLATDPENADIPIHSRWALLVRLRPWIRPAAIIGTTLLLVVVVLVHYAGGSFKDVNIPYVTAPIPGFPNEKSFAFDKNPRPSWLDENPVGGPLGLRIAVVSRADEFDKRQALRESVFLGVRDTDVKLDFRFFVGAPVGLTHWVTSVRLSQENRTYGDVVVLEDIDDIPERLSEKRYAALKWGGSVPHDSYDYFMTIDSDTFVRLGALARRMPSFLKSKNIKPREQPVLIGRMGEHLTYFMNTVPDGNEDPSLEDEYLKGPWFPYPSGIGYMLSSSLVNTLLSTEPPLPHHIHYPSDDVMIGAWIAALRYFPDKSVEFETTAEHSPEPVHKVVPKPYLPERWHDFIERGGHDASFSWSSICVHHVTADEMIKFRAIDAIKGEWDI
ncbi:galactosyltransferase-domain-containing protein [Cyathus striatus]|nr:galactosyltransferase-domain-containing protein [Cyathus striatus]